MTEQLVRKSAGERRRERRLAEIADAARTLFATRGVTETSMAEIADAVDLSPKALYYYFTSKRALLESVLERGFLYFEPAGLAAARTQLDGLDLREALIQSSTAAVSELVAHGDLLRLSFSETFRGNATTQARHERYMSNWIEHVLLILDARDRDHALEPQVRRTVAEVIVDSLFGFSVDRVLRGHDQARAADADEGQCARYVQGLVDSMLDGVLTRSPRVRSTSR